ncbi:hypothetical protein TWF730_005421 [Orbilia blumenaviensis]|uniref:Polycomb protein VEFS-Box domain-containing protein n=1 Tax=Orbilia blumenaviensis TaxID=1796055 RepID=A0AAV9VJQ2_9PEZI
MRQKREPVQTQPSGRSKLFRAPKSARHSLANNSGRPRVIPNNNDNNNASSSTNNPTATYESSTTSAQPCLTVSDAYKGNIVLYDFFARYSQKVFLERNVTRVLNDQARLLKAENEGRKGGRRYWNRDGKSRKMSEIVRRLGLSLVFDDETMFGLMVEGVREVPKEWLSGKVLHRCECEIKLLALPPPPPPESHRPRPKLGPQELEQTDLELLTETVEIISKPDPDDEAQQIFCAAQPVVIPLRAFGIKDEGNGEEDLRLAASGYEIKCQVQLRKASKRSDLVERESGEIYETTLRFDEDLVCADGSNEGLMTATKIGRTDCGPEESLQLKLKFGWNKPITHRIINNDKKQSKSRIGNLSTKRRKLICIDYTFHGHVKNFDEKEAHKNAYNSTVNLKDKLYVFSCQGHAFICVICKNTTFGSLERLQFHLLHAHAYFTCSVESYAPGRSKEQVEILVEPAVHDGKRYHQHAGNNDRKFLWVRPKGAGDRAFNLSEYLKGDTAWARGVTIPEAERKLMNSPARMLKKMQIVPDLGAEVGKRKCTAPRREDGKGYVRFLTGRKVAEGDELSESGDDIDEDWILTEISKKIRVSDFSTAGKDFLKMWGAHVMVEGPRSNHHLHDCLIRFCRQNKKALRSPALRSEFDKFILALRTRGQLDKFLVRECKKLLDTSDL